jgi:DNA topoisomerase-1
VAKRLGNTPSVCRKCYVHPGVLEHYMTGGIVRSLKRRLSRAANPDRVMQQEEDALLRLLKKGASQKGRSRLAKKAA